MARCRRWSVQPNRMVAAVIQGNAPLSYRHRALAVVNLPRDGNQQPRTGFNDRPFPRHLTEGLTGFVLQGPKSGKPTNNRISCPVNTGQMTIGLIYQVVDISRLPPRPDPDGRYSYCPVVPTSVLPYHGTTKKIRLSLRVMSKRASLVWQRRENEMHPLAVAHAAGEHVDLIHKRHPWSGGIHNHRGRDFLNGAGYQILNQGADHPFPFWRARDTALV